MNDAKLGAIVFCITIILLVLHLFLYLKTGDAWNWKWFFSRSFREQIRLEKGQRRWHSYIASDSVRQFDEDGNEID